MPQNWWDAPAAPARTDPPGTSGHWWDAPAPVAAPAAPIGAEVAAAPSIWDRLNTPLTNALSSGGKYLNEKLGLKSLADKLNASVTDEGWLSSLKGFAAGAIGGAGNVPGGFETAGKALEQNFLSPAGIAMTAGGLGAAGAAARGARTAAATLRAIEAAGAGVNAAQGVEHAINAPDTQGKWLGAFQGALGGLGTIAGVRGVNRFLEEAANIRPRIAPGQTAGDYAPAAPAPGRMPYVPQDVPNVPYERSGGGSTQPKKTNLYSDATEPVLPGPRRAATPINAPLRAADVEMPPPAAGGNWWKSPAPGGPITHAAQIEGLDPAQVVANTGTPRSAADIVRDRFFPSQPSPRGMNPDIPTAEQAIAEASTGSEPLGGPDWRSPARPNGQQPLEPAAAPTAGVPPRMIAPLPDFAPEHFNQPTSVPVSETGGSAPDLTSPIPPFAGARSASTAADRVGAFSPAGGGEIHPLIRQAHESLLPKWAADVARQRGDGNPIGVIDPTEDLQAFHDRVMNEPDPRKLWSTERKARLAIDAERAAKGGGDTGESGFIDPTAAFYAASTLGGGVVGGGLGAWAAPKGRKLKGGIEGALLGAAIPTLVKHREAAQALRAFGLFGSPVTVAKKVLADSSNVLGEAFTRTVSGQGGGGKLLRSVFSPDTLTGIATHFRNPEASNIGFPTPQPFSPGVQRIIGAPTRALGAVTAGMRDAIMRGDLSPKEADRLTSIADPQTELGRGILHFHQKGGSLARFAMPVARVPVNMLEMGAEATPLLGYAKLAVRALKGKGDMPTGTEWARATAKQAIGGAAALYGAHEQATRDPNAKESAAEKVARVLLTTGLGGYGMLPEALGAGMEAARKKNPPAATTVPGRMMSAAAQTLIRNLPLPTGFDLTPSHWPGQFAPGALTTAGELAGGPAPNTLEQPDALDALVARIPWLNHLLTPKATSGSMRMSPMEMGPFR